MSADSSKSLPIQTRSTEKKKSCSEDELLKCGENLDRRSPDLWPEKFPGFRDFVVNSPHLMESNRESPEWLKGLEKEDMDLLWSFGKMNSTQIYEKIKSLYNLAMELSVEEEREMVRGRFLDVLSSKDDL